MKRKTEPVIILASASPRRKELLKQIGIKAVIRPSRKQEIYQAVSPAGIVKELSRKKAEDIAFSCRKNAVVIGADTIVVKDGDILGKPKNGRDAVRMLKKLSGSRHSVYTGVTVIRISFTDKKAAVEKRITFSARTDVDVYPMTEAEIREYVRTGEPMDKAGAYGIQGRFAGYIRGIRGDYTNVVGLPLGKTVRALKKIIGEDFCNA